MTSTLNQDNIGVTTNSTVPQPSRKVIETLGNYIKVTDTDEACGLTNFCYVSDPKTDDEQFRSNVGIIQQCRGVVFDGENVVMRAFSHNDEFGQSEMNVIGEKLTGIGGGDLSEGLKVCRFYESHEGALIRMFFYKGKWFTTTHRKLNAFKSKWGCNDSYGSIFKNALKHQISTNEDLKNSLPDTNGNFFDAFQSGLDKSHQYMFLVRNTKENRLVSTAPDEPTMYHVGTFVNGELDLDIDIKVNRPMSFTFDNIESLHEHIASTHPADTSGLVVFCPGNLQFKISSDIYMSMFSVRGNQQSIKFRYLQIRMDQRSNETLRMMYPEKNDEFNEYEQLLQDISKKIHNAYMNRFIHKQFVSVPVGEYVVVKTAHKWFWDDRDNRRVTFHVIRDIMNEQSATSLNQMIKKQKHDLFTIEKESKNMDVVVEEVGNEMV
jgi:hypothetical protein